MPLVPLSKVGFTQGKRFIKQEKSNPEVGGLPSQDCSDARGLIAPVNDLAYKAQAIGCAVVYVNPAYSSRECNVCGHVDKANRNTQESFLCMA
jgi:hypothetical protein